MNKLDFDELLKEAPVQEKQQLKLPDFVDKELFKTLINETLKLSCQNISVNRSPELTSPFGLNYTFALSLEPFSSPFYISMTESSLETIFLSFYGQKSPFDDPRLKKAALGFCLLKMIKAANELKIFPNQSFSLIDSTAFDQKMTLDQIALELDEGMLLSFSIFYPDSFKDEFIAKWGDTIKNTPHDALLECSIYIGNTRLKINQLELLKKDQILLLDEMDININTQKGIGYLYFQSSPLASVRMHHQTIKIMEHSSGFKENPMEESNSNLASLEELDVTLQVEYAKLNLKLSELTNLTIGQTLELHKENPVECALIMNGKKIAKGSLVKVGEKVGFLIEESSYGA